MEQAIPVHHVQLIAISSDRNPGFARVHFDLALAKAKLS